MVPHDNKFVHGFFVYLFFLRWKPDRKLVQPFDVLPAYLLKGTCDNGFPQKLAKDFGIKDILRPLRHSKNSDFIWKVGDGKKRISFFISRNRLSVVWITP